MQVTAPRPGCGLVKATKNIPKVGMRQVRLPLRSQTRRPARLCDSCRCELPGHASSMAHTLILEHLSVPVCFKKEDLYDNRISVHKGAGMRTLESICRLTHRLAVEQL